ncbi:hypothetical protein [Leifsonia xyli]|nr:hypothetical protein [Leifsonia xyli]
MFTWIVVDALLVTTIIRSPYGPLEWVQQNWILTILVLVVGIAPFAIWGPIYRRLAAPERSVASGVWWGVLVYFYNLYIMITTPRAFYRAVRGKQGWAKTRRNGENLGLGAVAREA